MVEERRATRLLARGDHLDGLFIVIEGRLKLYMLSCNGDERVLRVLQSGDSFGEAIMFKRSAESGVRGHPVAGPAGLFPARRNIGRVDGESELHDGHAGSMSALMRNLIQDLETCCMQNALQRTVNYLLREAVAATPMISRYVAGAQGGRCQHAESLGRDVFARAAPIAGMGLIEINRRTIYLRDREGLSACGRRSIAARRRTELPPPQRRRCWRRRAQSMCSRTIGSASVAPVSQGRRISGSGSALPSATAMLRSQRA